MRIYVDEKKVKRQALIGRIALFGSLAILVGGLLLTLFGQQLGLFSLDNLGLFYVIYTVILILGFGISRVGMYYGNRYLAAGRPEMVLRESLKGLERSFTLMVFQPPVDYYLIEPGGVTVLIMKTQAGKIDYKNGKWKSRQGMLSFWLGRDEPLGNPDEEATQAIAKISAIFTDKIPNLKIPIRAIIVFSNPKVDLELEPSAIKVLRSIALKDYIRGEGKLKEMPKSIQRQIRASLNAPELPTGERPPDTK
ncbi:MAG TPA: hypothetical protein VGK87_12100 [Anaerolineae bacterium]